MSIESATLQTFVPTAYLPFWGKVAYTAVLVLIPVLICLHAWWQRNYRP